jgi:hypothetical protein
MRFWIHLILRYSIAALTALAAALLVSFCATMAMAASYPGDDSPGLGVLFFLLLFLGIVLFLPITLGFSAERAQKKVSGRPFSWKQAFIRVLFAAPISLALFYYLGYVYSTLSDSRPHYWQIKESLLIGLAVIAGYFALRVRRTLHSTSS